MGNAKERIGAAGVAMAKAIFRIVLYICIIFLMFWAGKTTYEFAYSVFNEEAVRPGAGEEITVEIPEGTGTLDIAKTLVQKGLLKNSNPYVFWVQERLSIYHGQLMSGTYNLSTAYTPTRIMGILAGDEAMMSEEHGGDES